MSAKQKGQFIINDIPVSSHNKDQENLSNTDISKNNLMAVEGHIDKGHSDSKRIYQPNAQALDQDIMVRADATRSRTGLSLTGSLDGSKTMVVSTPLYGDKLLQLNAHIVCIVGPPSMIGRFWSISDKESITIGRSQKSDIAISDTSLSKKHLCVRMDQKNNQVFVQDQQSTNGTIINNKLIDAGREVVITDNSKIKLGNIILKFLDKGNPEILSVMETFNKAFRDSLTGIGNRLLLDRRAEELFRKSKINNTPLSLILFDIDHFKKVNDTYGHLAGDFILKEVVRVAKACFRSDDLFVRCGGEEFCIIVQSPVERAEKAIEIARQKIETHLFQYKEKEIKVTISAGVTCQQEVDRGWKEIYDRADKLLYKAKTSGRNKTFSNM